MTDREKVIKGLAIHKTRICENQNGEMCPYWSNEHCGATLSADALELLKEQETHDTRKSRIFQCAECGYGIEDIFLNSEHDYPIIPLYCPNCGRLVK